MREKLGDELWTELMKCRSPKYSITKLLKDFKKYVVELQESTHLFHLFSHRKLIQLLTSNNLLTKDDVEFLYSIAGPIPFVQTPGGSEFTAFLIENKSISLESLVKTIEKNSPNSYAVESLLQDSILFDKLAKKNLLTIQDAQFLLDRASNASDLSYIFGNVGLSIFIFENFLLTDVRLLKFERFMQEGYCSLDGVSYTLFDLVQNEALGQMRRPGIGHRRELVARGSVQHLAWLGHMYATASSFKKLDESERRQLFEFLCEADEHVQRAVLFITENSLQDSYASVSELKTHLLKPQQSSVLNI